MRKLLPFVLVFFTLAACRKHAFRQEISGQLDSGAWVAIRPGLDTVNMNFNLKHVFSFHQGMTRGSGNYSAERGKPNLLVFRLDDANNYPALQYLHQSWTIDTHSDTVFFLHTLDASGNPSDLWLKKIRD